MDNIHKVIEQIKQVRKLADIEAKIDMLNSKLDKFKDHLDRSHKKVELQAEGLDPRKTA